MDVNTARIIMTKMQGCFKDLKVPFISEDEMLNCEGFTDAIKFRSWLEKNNILAEIISSVYPSFNIVHLSMNYYENIENLDESRMRDLFNLLNAVNNLDPKFYWVILPRDNKLEFRTAYILSGSRLNEEQFKSVLMRFLEQGPRYYLYVKRLIDKNENSKKLFYEMQVELKVG